MTNNTIKFNPSIPINHVAQPLYDYGKLYAGVSPYCDCYPSSIEEVCDIITQAYKSMTPIRVRASGHTFNGCTLPRENEILLRTDKLNWFSYNERGTVTVGAGALVWDIRDMVNEYGFQLPVYNGGWAGPTLGGYINAGGFGKGSLSDEYGGLWENILSITIVDGMGTSHEIGRTDDRFKWLFSSFGQLGVIVEAKLKIVPSHPAALLAYPTGLEGEVPARQIDDPKDNDNKNSKQEKILFWFSLLISPDQEEIAWREMADFCERHQDIITPDGGWAGPLKNGEPIGYHYKIKFHNFNPPLLYPYDENFIVMGVMSYLNITDIGSNSSIIKIESDFIDLSKRNKFKLYPQAENIGQNINYRKYYSDVIYERFVQLKNEFDPHYIVNRSTVFPPEDVK